MFSTLVVFGATGGTGRHFTAKALSEGHKVRAFVRSPEKVKTLGQENLSLFKGSITDETINFKELLSDSNQVVIMLGDKEAQKSTKINLTFIKRLVPAMREYGVHKLLYQAGGLSKPPEQSLSFFLWFLRNTVARPFNGQHEDNEAVMEYLLKEANDLQWIVHRAGIYSDGPSKGSLIRSPTKFSIATFKDCADYNYKILSDPSSIHTCDFSFYDQ